MQHRQVCCRRTAEVLRDSQGIASACCDVCMDAALALIKQNACFVMWFPPRCTGACSASQQHMSICACSFPVSARYARLYQQVLQPE